ncbi:hypothetical protein AKJ41_01285 [candidate division MSBL1 archaeon SCGC-AAA259O05]|uniref:Uncharacterized protein n=1 Tax=candidate division MSBL1 archaeon SCGC-AAA259O05 TaxID=1698271 RepID=A0A133V4X3_9EURY|nr:hypothetical protein AKJ41_01285 [candidate division MSBL1 archaeon SCGC-AAA259O05]
MISRPSPTEGQRREAGKTARRGKQRGREERRQRTEGAFDQGPAAGVFFLPAPAGVFRPLSPSPSLSLLFPSLHGPQSPPKGSDRPRGPGVSAPRCAEALPA